jgi:membrane-bound serine protease (ClpP class)
MVPLELAYLLIVVGVVMMAAELLIPTGGVLIVVGVAGLIAGVAMVFSYDVTRGLVTLLLLVVGLVVGGPLLVHWWPRSALGRRLTLSRPDDDATVAAMPVHLELEGLRGRYGKTVSPLRPAGVTDFDGRRVDSLSEGPFIEAGRWVRCVDVRAGRVLVREVAGPPDLEDIDFG